MKRNQIIAIVAIIVILLIVLLSQKKDAVNAPDQTQESANVNTNVASNNNSIPAEPEATVRTKVIELGQKMKLVSTIAADFKNQVQVQYGTYVTPALLAQWKANPSQALAATSKNPWPDRIEIVSVTKVNADTYKVEGTVVMVGADSPVTVSTYPVTITVRNDRGAWLITEVVK